VFHGTAVAPRYQVAHARGRSPRSPAALAGYQQRRMRHANNRRDGLRHGTPICTSRRGCGIAPESATQPVREGAPTAARAGRRGSPRPSRWLRGNSLTGRSQNCGRRNYSYLFARWFFDAASVRRTVGSAPRQATPSTGCRYCSVLARPGFRTDRLVSCSPRRLTVWQGLLFQRFPAVGGNDVLQSINRLEHCR